MNIYMVVMCEPNHGINVAEFVPMVLCTYRMYIIGLFYGIPYRTYMLMSFSTLSSILRYTALTILMNIGVPLLHMIVRLRG